LANNIRRDNENIVRRWQKMAKLAVVEENNVGADVNVVRAGINGEGSRSSPPDQALLLFLCFHLILVFILIGRWHLTMLPFPLATGCVP
jgi:hypothetical protein